MGQSYIELSYLQVGGGLLLVLVCLAFSIALKLGVEGRLAVASLRTVGQLFFVGLVLEWVFQAQRWYVVVALSLVMTLIAGAAAIQRSGRRYPGMLWNSIFSIWSSSWLVTAITIFGILQVKPWYEARYFIPLIGMILGNSLNGISISLDRLGEELLSKRDQVEARLALGATRWEAARAIVASSIRVGMIPIINSMMVVGIVSIPGMMTGQLLGGISPTQAVRYQIVIMYLMTATTTLGTFSVVLLGYRRLFDSRHRFLSHLITIPERGKRRRGWAR